jgi:hypothetical protein
MENERRAVSDDARRMSPLSRRPVVAVAALGAGCIAMGSAGLAAALLMAGRRVALESGISLQVVLILGAGSSLGLLTMFILVAVVLFVRQAWRDTPSVADGH